MAAYRSKYYYTFPQKRKKNQTGFGYIYFIRNEETKRIKIGKTVDVPSRLSALQTANDSVLKVITFLAVPKETMKFWEEALHDAVKEYRVIGEWFELPDAVLQQTIAVYRRLIAQEYM